MVKEFISQLPPDKLSPFAKHPYQVREDAAMDELVESVRTYGILSPLLARPKGEGYELVSGHRRRLAAQKLGLPTVPVLVREMTDDEAVILMVDSNLQRENLLPSEKAKAYKLKLDAMKRQGQKRVGTSPQNGEKLKENYSVSILGEQVKESATQIQRYVRLNLLIPPLVEAVDKGFLKLAPAADFLSHLSEKEQTYLLLVMERDEVSPSLGQAQRLKQLSSEGKLENNIIDLIMREEKPLERKVTIRNDRLQKYFPASYTPKQMEDVIIKLLEGWHRKRQQEQVR